MSPDNTILIVGAGPVGLMTALACKFYGLDYILFEEDSTFSSDTKAGTILTRTIEAFRRYGVDAAVLQKALRVEEIGEIERSTNKRRHSVETRVLGGETRFPFVLNLPQHHLEPILAQGLQDKNGERVRLRHQLLSFTQTDSGVTATFETPEGTREFSGKYLLACDGGRSAIRTSLGVQVEGHTLDVRYMLVDVRVDLDTLNPRDYPYLAYFSDPQEWMILVRQPHCWRFLFPITPGVEQLEADELREKVTHFVGSVSDMEILNTITYRVHHRIASQWRSGNVFLMGDAAHLITPMWALGMNTGVLDSLSLPWRLAWVLRGWAPSSLLDGYEAEQRPLAAYGSGEMAEAARKIMGGAKDMESGDQMSDWALAMTRCLLAVKVDVDGKSDWSIVRKSKLPMTTGERIPDFTLFTGEGRSVRLHDLVDDSFVALHFTDARRRIALPDDEPGLRNFIVSRWDAPLDSGLRDRSLLDVGNMLFERIGCPENTIVLVRPDDHVAAIKPIAGNDARALYSNALGRQQ